MNKPVLSCIAKAASLGVPPWTLIRQVYDTHDQTGFIKWGNAPAWREPGWHEAVAAHDYAAFTPGVWDGHRADLDKILKVNIDFMAGTYFQSRNIPYWMGAQVSGYCRDLWDALSRSPILNDSGNPALAWPGTRLYDFTDTAVQKIAAEVLAGYVKRTGLDWVFVDDVSTYFDANANLPAWLTDAVVVEALARYMGVLREVLPSRVKIISNGALAIKDDRFAKLVDGLFIEDFPRYFFGEVGPNWENATDPDYPGSLYSLTKPRYRNGQGIVMIGNDNNEDFTDLYEIPGLTIMATQKDEGLPPIPRRSA